VSALLAYCATGARPLLRNVKCRSDAMKLPPILIVGLTAGFVSGCGAPPKENYQQAVESGLSQATCAMQTLKALDSGDVARTRRVAMVPLFLNLDAARYSEVKGMISLPQSQKEEWTRLARETLDYVSEHKDEWDPRLLDFQAGMRGMRYFLTHPEEARRLDEITAHLARIEERKSEVQKP
jgi:hypothetical protein